MAIESHHANSFAVSRVLAMKVKSADNFLAPQNSSLGIVCSFFAGITKAMHLHFKDFGDILHLMGNSEVVKNS